MRYYVFGNKGTLKLDDSMELSSLVIDTMITQFEEVSVARFYKLRAQDASSRAALKTKACYAATKKKAVNIKDAIKK